MKSSKQKVASAKSLSLHHFTSHYHYSRILTEGIMRGDVPTSPNTGYNAVWLTSDPDPDHQEWAGGPLDKTAIRLSVQIMSDDTSLHHWPLLARKLGVPRWWYDALDQTGGGGSNNWYVYHQPIAPDRLVVVETKPMTMQELEFIMAISGGDFRIADFAYDTQGQVTVAHSNYLREME